MYSEKYIAADFGATSGRLMLGAIDRTIHLQEMHRFSNHTVEKDGHIQWDFQQLFQELKKGLSGIAASGIRHVQGVGLNTWGVDFGLIGSDGQLLENPYSYRDSRTQGMIETAFEKMPKDDIYSATGIQFMELNTLYQLLSMVVTGNPLLDRAEILLFMPDLFNFYLTGIKQTEYTIASTSQMLNAVSRQWDRPLFKQLNLPFHLMPDIAWPGATVGPLKRGIRNETGLQIDNVIAPATHDTASAVAAVPARTGASWAFLSSGTWSLLGTERSSPLINPETMSKNFTNEGGANHTIRFLKNLSGMWLLECCRKQWHDTASSYETLLYEAETASPFRSLIHVDDACFLNPPDMLQAIQACCRKSHQPVPETKGEITRCILESLAFRYRQIIGDINQLQGEKIEVLHIVGGGSRNTLLNQFTADACGIPVLAGPVEATALGNILIQAVAAGRLDSIGQGRALISKSFPIREYLPQNAGLWEDMFPRYLQWTQNGQSD